MANRDGGSGRHAHRDPDDHQPAVGDRRRGHGSADGSGTGCLLNSSVTAAAGSAPQLSAPVDAGDYCVKLFDVGGLTAPMSFTLTIVYP